MSNLDLCKEKVVVLQFAEGSSKTFRRFVFTMYVHLPHQGSKLIHPSICYTNPNPPSYLKPQPNQPPSEDFCQRGTLSICSVYIHNQLSKG